MSDFLDEKKREITARMEEIKPLVEEYRQLEAAVAALDGAAAPAAAATRRAPTRAQRKNGSGGGGEGTGRRGRPKGSGTRSKEALALVRDRPGITIPELADAMSIKQNYLYRVMPELQKDNMVRKEGRGWHATDAA